MVLVSAFVSKDLPLGHRLSGRSGLLKLSGLSRQPSVSHDWLQGQIQDFPKGEGMERTMASAWSASLTGVWAELQRGPGTEPLVRRASPPEAESFSSIFIHKGPKV